MSLLSAYRNQEIIWRRVKRDVNTGEPVRNIDGEVEYDESTITVRWEPRIAVVLNNQGEEVTSQARAFTEDPVEPGDVLVNGRVWPVISAITAVSLSGTTLHREVSV